jgi:hypothetical protein
MWGMTLADVLEMISSGRLLSRTQGSFSFVRLPHFSIFGKPLPVEERPPTFTPAQTHLGCQKLNDDATVTPAEQAALEGKQDSEEESELGPPPDEDPNDNRITGWREGRRRAGATRRKPGAF